MRVSQDQKNNLPLLQSELGVCVSNNARARPGRRDQSHTQDIFLQDIQSVRYTFVLDRWATLFLLNASSTRIGQNSEALLPLQRRQKGCRFSCCRFSRCHGCHSRCRCRCCLCHCHCLCSCGCVSLHFSELRCPGERRLPSLPSVMKYSRMARSHSRRRLRP